jgi:hypothetical protein
MRSFGQAGEADFRIIVVLPWLIVLGVVIMSESATYVPAILQYLNNLPAPNPSFSEIYSARVHGWPFWTGVIGLGLFISWCKLLSFFRKEGRICR